MANASRDNNHVPTKLGVLCTDGVTLVPIAIDPNGDMKVDSVSSISFDPSSIDFRDENYRPCWMGVRSDDGVTPCPVFVNADGAVLIDT